MNDNNCVSVRMLGMLLTVALAPSALLGATASARGLADACNLITEAELTSALNQSERIFQRGSLCAFSNLNPKAAVHDGGGLYLVTAATLREFAPRAAEELQCGQNCGKAGSPAELFNDAKRNGGKSCPSKMVNAQRYGAQCIEARDEKVWLMKNGVIIIVAIARSIGNEENDTTPGQPMLLYEWRVANIVLPRM